MTIFEDACVGVLNIFYGDHKGNISGKLTLSITVLHTNALVLSLAAARECRFEKYNFTSHPIAQTWAPLIICYQISEETSMECQF